MIRLVQDFRIGFRGLLNSPGFTAVVVTTLALGTGASSTMFSVLRASLLRPPPFAEADRIVMLFLTRQEAGKPEQRTRWSYPEFQNLRERAPSSLENIAAYAAAGVNLTGRDEPERVEGEIVSADYFRVLQVKPEVGRVFLPEEDVSTRPAPVVVLGHGLWQRRFGGEPGVVGSKIIVNQTPLQVVGVMPADFQGLSGQADVWIPMPMGPSVHDARELTTTDRYHTVIARLRPGQTVGSASVELEIIAARLLNSVPPGDGPVVRRGATAISANAARTDPAERNSILILFAAVGFLLLITCANTANLILVRSAARMREIAVRFAIGSSRWRVIRLLVAESILLAVIGGGFGVLLATGSAELVGTVMPEWSPSRSSGFAAIGSFSSPQVDPAVLAFACVIALITALILGLVPAFAASRTSSAESLRAGARSSTSHRPVLFGLDAFSILTMSEIALAVVLLSGAGLTLETLRRLKNLPLGFDAQNLITFQVQAPESQYRPSDTPILVERLMASVSKVPGVQSATAGLCPPLRDYCIGRDWVTPDYFNTLQIPLIRGRSFTNADRLEHPRVGIINETAAKRFWPAEDPVGKRVPPVLGASVSADSLIEIVGVVKDSRYYGLPGHAIEPQLYLPFYQIVYPPAALVTVRSRLPLEQLVRALRRAVMEVDPNLPIAEVRTMRERLGGALERQRLSAMLLSTFAALALVIAALGVYGVMTYTSSQRMREFGIRIALGGTPANIRRLVLGRAFTLTAAGLTVGILGSFGLTRVMAAQLFGVRATDLSVFGWVCAVLTCVSIIASYVPARRAMKVQPLVVLRSE